MMSASLRISRETLFSARREISFRHKNRKKFLRRIEIINFLFNFSSILIKYALIVNNRRSHSAH